MDRNIRLRIMKFDFKIQQYKIDAVVHIFQGQDFHNDSIVTKFEQIFAAYSPETVRKVL